VTLGPPPPGYERLVLRNACCDARATIRDSEILYTRDALRNALIDAGCEDPL